MKMCLNCQYFHDFKKANDYFQLSNYADAWITAALSGTAVEIPQGGYGGADFSTFSFGARARKYCHMVVFVSAKNTHRQYDLS